MTRRTITRDLTYYRTRAERTTINGNTFTTFTPYAYDGPLTYEVAKEAIRKMCGQMVKVAASEAGPKSLRKLHRDTLDRTAAALSHLYGPETSDRLFLLAAKLYREGRI